MTMMVWRRIGSTVKGNEEGDREYIILYHTHS